MTPILVIGLGHGDSIGVNEDLLLEASKSKAKPKKKPKPYDFMTHLKDISKGGEMKNSPLRFGSGERMRIQPEEAGIILQVHKTMNLMNQAKAAKLMRSTKGRISQV